MQKRNVRGQGRGKKWKTGQNQKKVESERGEGQIEQTLFFFLPLWPAESGEFGGRNWRKRVGKADRRMGGGGGRGEQMVRLLSFHQTSSYSRRLQSNLKILTSKFKKLNQPNLPQAAKSCLPSYNLNQDLGTGAAKNKNVYKLRIVYTSLGWTM